MKRLLSLFLSVVMLLSMTAGIDLSAYAQIYSGRCGDNVTWTLDSDTGKLTISGSGKMTDYSSSYDVPWYNQRANVKTVDIKSGVTSICEGAFSSYDSLTSITIPDSVTSIGYYAFSDCGSLTSINVDTNNNNYSSQDGVLFNKDKTELIQYLIGNARTSYVIPISVASIGYSAFCGCDSLTSITIPNSVTSIGDEAFSYCRSLTSITIPNSVTSIGYYAFSYCRSLTSITIPDSVTSIGNSAFYKTAYYNDGSNWANSVLYISNCLIEANENISGSYTVKDNIGVIADGAFEDCDSLTSIIIPDSVTSIGDYAFELCDSLTDVYYNGSQSQWNNISIGDYNDCLTNATIHYAEDAKLFTLRRDNNSFIHNNSNESDGFFGITDYQIKDNYMRAKLINLTLSNGELSSVMDTMYSKWEGSCYGIATTMGMNYLCYSSIDDISTYPASNFYSLKLPYQNPKLLDTINYYQLTQLLKNYGTKSKDCVMTLFGFSSWLNDAPQKLSTYTNSDFYKLLINAVVENYTVLLGYGEENGSGHAIITCGVEQISDNVYRIKLYDENDIGEFGYLTITNNNGKYTAVSTYTYIYQSGDKFIDSREDLLGHLNYMYYLPLNNLSNIAPYKTKSTKNMVRSYELLNEKSSLSEDSMGIIVELGNAFSINFDEDKYLSYNGKTFDGNIEIYDMRFVESSNNSKIIIETEKTKSVEYSSIYDTNISVYDNDNYYSLIGSNIDSANISLSNGITISGNKYNFTATANKNTSDNDFSIVKVNGSANDDVVIKSLDGNVSVNSDEVIQNVTAESISKDSEEVILDNSDVKEFVADKDNNITFDTPQHEHNYTVTVTQPTCILQGYTTYSCECGEEYIDNYKNALGHNFGNNNKACLVCGEANPNYVEPKPTEPEKPTQPTQPSNQQSTAPTQSATQPSATAPVANIAEKAPKGAAKVNGEWVAKKQKNTKISKLTKAKKSFKASWKKVSGVTGYQIQYSTSKKFTKKTTKSVTVKGSKKTSATVKKLKSKKKYYVRIRTYKNVKLNGKTVKVYSSWSKAKTVTTK